MQRLQSFKYELMPMGEQQRKMRQFAQQKNPEEDGKFVSFAGMCKWVTVWRNDAERTWMRDASVHTQQQALKDLERALGNFFGKPAGFLAFKWKSLASDNFRYPDPKQIV
jgi:putative transposase